jgi:hypothetical protein
MIVAQYEVLGNCVKRCARPGRDDRTPGSWSAYCFANTRNHRSSLRDGRVFSTISRHFVPGYYQMSLPRSHFGLWRTSRDWFLTDCSGLSYYRQSTQSHY